MSVVDHRFEKQDAFSGAETLHDATPTARATWLDRYSLNTKLRGAILGNIIFLGSVGIIILGCWLYFINWGGALGDMIAAERNSAQAALYLTDAQEALEELTETGNEASAEAIRPALVSAHEHVANAQKWIETDLPYDTNEQLAAFDVRLVEAIDAFNALQPSPSQAELQAFNAELIELRADLRQYIEQMRGYIAETSDDFYGNAPWALGFAVVFLALSIVLTFLGLKIVIRNVVDVIQSITTAMSNLAAGDNDVSIPGSARADEIGEMSRALEIFRAKSLELGDLNSTRAKDAEKQLAQQQLLNQRAETIRRETSNILEGLAGRFEVSVGEVIASVSSATDQLRTTSQAMADLSRESAEQSRGAGSAMEAANVNVTAAAAATDEFALSISEISRQASGSAALARDASNQVDAASAQMNTLASAADEIGEIVGLIQTIAQRTNLLALNASIEAARGGEAGRGFAVVASEVKELANQTSAATQSVTERINAIQSSTNSSVDALTSIVEQITELEQSSVVIATAVDQQSLSGEELARNIDVAASGSAKVVERLEKLQAASQKTGGAVEDVVGSARELGRLAEEMRSKAGAFIGEVRNSARDLANSDAEIDQMVG
ncbi:methyl-accepting chemotaxis protein [Erythrobacter sp. YT30]|uniref:methyl-accepting chemotaxis protein n=1 Tax=Erythrobacter sp. YT30 TaxID=1735012 RepID=UPI000A7D1257|nr:HAMP domain-containing methyl-accepting chemotaxis protein [Erythrobacter sp. YT30]